MSAGLLRGSSGPVFEDVLSKRLVLQRLLSTVCDDILAAFEDVLSKRLVLHRLLSTVVGDLFVVFVQTW